MTNQTFLKAMESATNDAGEISTREGLPVSNNYDPLEA